MAVAFDGEEKDEREREREREREERTMMQYYI